MTPKEKATELFEYYFYKLQCHFSAVGDEIAKECALIAVDEVIEALQEHHWQNRLIIDFWQEVKHELEKL